MDPDLIKRHRRLPHWEMVGSTYFLTFRVSGLLSMPERILVLNHVRAGHGEFYELFAAVIMPDHGHAILKPIADYGLSDITKGIKGPAARMINKRRGTSGALWQDESFDRIIRDAAEFDEKLNYVINNPVRRDLVREPWDYPALLVLGMDG